MGLEEEKKPKIFQNEAVAFDDEEEEANAEKPRFFAPLDSAFEEKMRVSPDDFDECDDEEGFIFEDLPDVVEDEVAKEVFSDQEEGRKAVLSFDSREDDVSGAHTLPGVRTPQDDTNFLFKPQDSTPEGGVERLNSDTILPEGLEKLNFHHNPVEDIENLNFHRPAGSFSQLPAPSSSLPSPLSSLDTASYSSFMSSSTSHLSPPKTFTPHFSSPYISTPKTFPPVNLPPDPPPQGNLPENTPPLETSPPQNSPPHTSPPDTFPPDSSPPDTCPPDSSSHTQTDTSRPDSSSFTPSVPSASSHCINLSPIHFFASSQKIFDENECEELWSSLTEEEKLPFIQKAYRLHAQLKSLPAYQPIPWNTHGSSSIGEAVNDLKEHEIVYNKLYNRLRARYPYFSDQLLIQYCKAGCKAAKTSSSGGIAKAQILKKLVRS